MPIMEKEIDLYPEDLLDRGSVDAEPEHRWWAIYTRSRREKELMRQLKRREVPFYCPLVEKRYRSPAGRARRSYLPLFTNYVFIYGDEWAPYQAKTTSCTSQVVEVRDRRQLTQDLRNVRSLIESGAPVTLEEQLQPGIPVRVRSGPFAGQEGIVVRRCGRGRLVVAVDFLQQGASVEIDDFSLERIY